MKHSKQLGADRNGGSGMADPSGTGKNRANKFTAGPNPVRRFVGRLAGWYLGLLLLWFPAGDFYRDGLIAAGNLTLGSFFRGKEIVFQHHTDWKSVGIPKRADVAVLVRTVGWNHPAGRKQYVLAKPVATFYQPFTATVFVAALFLASRLGWRAGWRRGILAMAALHALMFVSVLIDVGHTVGEHLPDAAGVGSWLMTTVRLLHSSVTDWPAGVYLVPLLIWVALCRPRQMSFNSAG